MASPGIPLFYPTSGGGTRSLWRISVKVGESTRHSAQEYCVGPENSSICLEMVGVRGEHESERLWVQLLGVQRRNRGRVRLVFRTRHQGDRSSPSLFLNGQPLEPEQLDHEYNLGLPDSRPPLEELLELDESALVRTPA